MIKHKGKFIFGIIILLVLVIASLWGKNSITKTEQTLKKNFTAEEKIAIAQQIYEEQQEIGDFVADEPIKEVGPTPVVTDSFVVAENKELTEDDNLTCSLYVRCDTLLDNLQNLDESKALIVPRDGIIFAGENVEIYQGESVFNVLVREMKKNKIHLEFTKTPGYNSAYIEGIGNLYEFDCGELSGWLYKVNGQTPGCGCSSYMVEDGDVIEFLYSCNLGVDIGAYRDLSGE